MIASNSVSNSTSKAEKISWSSNGLVLGFGQLQVSLLKFSWTIYNYFTFSTVIILLKFVYYRKRTRDIIKFDNTTSFYQRIQAEGKLYFALISAYHEEFCNYLYFIIYYTVLIYLKRWNMKFVGLLEFALK